MKKKKKKKKLATGLTGWLDFKNLGLTLLKFRRTSPFLKGFPNLLCLQYFCDPITWATWPCFMCDINDRLLPFGVSRTDRDPPDRPTHPIFTWFQPEPTLLSVDFGFLRLRLDAGGSSGGFFSSKPEPLDPTEVIYISGEIELKSEEIQLVLNHIWWDLARSGHS